MKFCQWASELIFESRVADRFPRSVCMHVYLRGARRLSGGQIRSPPLPSMSLQSLFYLAALMRKILRTMSLWLQSSQWCRFSGMYWIGNNFLTHPLNEQYCAVCCNKAFKRKPKLRRCNSDCPHCFTFSHNLQSHTLLSYMELRTWIKLVSHYKVKQCRIRQISKFKKWNVHGL